MILYNNIFSMNLIIYKYNFIKRKHKKPINLNYTTFINPLINIIII